MASDNGGAHPKYFPRTEIDIGDEDRDRDGAITNDKGAPLRRLESFEINGSEPSIGNSFVSQVSSMSTYLCTYSCMYDFCVCTYGQSKYVGNTHMFGSLSLYVRTSLCMYTRTYFTVQFAFL